MDFLIKVNRVCLYIFIFSACFEYWDPFGFANTISIAKIGIIPYFISSLPFIKKDLTFSFISRYLSPLIIFILAGIMATVFNDQYANSIGDVINIRLLQLVLVMTLICAHINLDNKVLKGILNVYVAGMFIMASMYMFFGIGEQYNGGRLFLFGENANQTGMKTTLALLLLIYGFINRDNSFKKKAFSLILTIPILYLLIESGSRGALLSLLIGLFIVILLGKMQAIKKIGMVLLSTLFSIGLFSFIYTNDVDFRNRIVNSIERGDTSGRTKLWEAAYRIIQDNFIFGVGNPGMMPTMRIYSGIYQQPHNLVLELWLTSGILGLIFFMTFLIRLGKDLTVSTRNFGHSLYMALFIVVLANMVKSGGSVGLIFAWIFFGILIGSIVINKKNHQKDILP